MEEHLASKIDSFFSQYRHQHYKKGEIIIRADDDPTSIFYLKNGLVKQYAISKKGDELVLNLYKPVSFFPMSHAINHTPNTYFFEAITDAEIWKAPSEKVVEFVKTNPDVLFNLLSRVYRGLDGMLLRTAYLMSGSAYARLITELLIHTKRFGTKAINGKVELSMSESDIATSAGMARETVSREIKLLKDKGLVTLGKNGIVVHDVSKLEEELAGDF